MYPTGIRQFVRYYFNLLIGHVFIVLYGVLPLYCVFETCIKSEKCIKTLFRGIRAIVLYSTLPAEFSQPFPEQINAKQKLLIL